MALASGNSIYVAAQLLCDPYEIPHEYEIRRIVGNLGRAGIALLVAPKIPQIIDPNPEHWARVKHASFDGLHNGNFGQTSLHLSFTGFETPLVSDAEKTFGYQGTPIYYLETLVSLFDEGVWVADLDVLKSLRNPLLQRLTFDSCHHSTMETVTPITKTCLTSIDNWTEFIDKPEGHGIARASRNWLARLALASLNVQRRAHTVVLPESPCWICITTLTGRQYRTRQLTNFDPWMLLRMNSMCSACTGTFKKRTSKLVLGEPLILVW